MIQGHLQGQMSWSMSFKVAEVLSNASLKPAAVGFCDGVSLTVHLWLFPLCFVLLLVCPRKAISSSQNKSIASRRVLLSASMKICLSISRLYTQKDGLRWVIFSPENVGQLISYYDIYAKLEHIYPEKQQNNSKKDNGSKQMEGGDASRWNAG